MYSAGEERPYLFHLSPSSCPLIRKQEQNKNQTQKHKRKDWNSCSHTTLRKKESVVRRDHTSATVI